MMKMHAGSRSASVQPLSTISAARTTPMPSPVFSSRTSLRSPRPTAKNRFKPSSEEDKLQEGVAEVHTGFGVGRADTREPERNATRGPENDRLRFLRPPSNSNAERSADSNG